MELQGRDEDEKLLLEEKERLRMLRKQREEREERRKEETQDLNPQTENGAPALPPAVEPGRVSKRGTSGKKTGKLLLLGVFFCFLICGGWALTQGGWGLLSPSPDLPFGDADELGRDLLSGAEDLAASVNLEPSVEEKNVEEKTVEEETQNSEKTPEVPEPPEETFPDPSPEPAPERVQRGNSLIPALSKNYTNSAGMEFVLVPAGEFFMGSPENETGRKPDESPLHRVQIERSFYLGKYELSREEWQRVMGTEPFPAGEAGLPATNISWEEAQAFVSKLNALEDTDRYRLPSEAEWEYACRAKSQARFSFGDDRYKLSKYAWWKERPDLRALYPHPAGLKKPNRWGLYDMHGNAWEWVEDSWYNDYSEAPSDGRAREKEGSSYRVARGGSLKSSSASCRAANRVWFSEDVRNPDMGFRVLMEA